MYNFLRFILKQSILTKTFKVLCSHIHDRFIVSLNKFLLLSCGPTPLPTILGPTYITHERRNCGNPARLNRDPSEVNRPETDLIKLIQTEIMICPISGLNLNPTKSTSPVRYGVEKCYSVNIL